MIMCAAIAQQLNYKKVSAPLRQYKRPSSANVTLKHGEKLCQDGLATSSSGRRWLTLATIIDTSIKRHHSSTAVEYTKMVIPIAEKIKMFGKACIR
jgi:hypothetical protein